MQAEGRARRVPRPEGRRGLRDRDSHRHACDHLPTPERSPTLHERRRRRTLRGRSRRRWNGDDAFGRTTTDMKGGQTMATKDKNTRKSSEKKPAQKTLKEKRQAKKAK